MKTTQTNNCQKYLPDPPQQGAQDPNPHPKIID